MTTKTLNFDRAKNYYRNNPWKSRTLITAFIFILIFSFIRIILTPTIIYSTTSWLAEQGIESSIEDIDFDIVDGTVSLINAKGSSNGEALFNIGLIDLYWRWSPLSEKTVVITKVAVHQFQINIEQYTDEIIIGGVTIPLSQAPAEENTTEKPGADKEIKPWAASLGEVVFAELNICYLQHSDRHALADKTNQFVDYCVDLEKMTWGGTISYATDKELLKTNDLAISSTGNFSLNGLTVTDNKLDRTLLTSASNTLEGMVISGLNNIQVNKLIMNDLSALKRDDEKHNDTVRFSQLSIEDIKLSNMNSLSIKQITIDHPGLYLVKLEQSTWEHQQWIPSSNKQTTTDSNIDTQANAQFKLSLNNITINNPDLCHQNKITDFYYCFTSEALNWVGAINYDSQTSVDDKINLTAKGNFTLAQPDIRNLTINRTLLSFEMLKLDNLNVSSLEDINLNELSIDNLRALQRSDKQLDNTLAFSNLDIKEISYKKDAVAIDSIKLTGLSNTVSKNKSGDWEHDKWQPKTDKKPSANKNNTETAGKPLKISLNKVLIESDGEILFIDNTTKPAMKIGLRKLSFDIKQLYSTKPKSSSPFKLNAKTLRHSTIDIKGSVKPFDDKVSFTADGDLKGFDLRAATPATQKTIGHIIKSGQLDAKLELLAKDGVLDSNITLSLYQFHIESMSKEAAAELDAEFGMPLNQTLVLLRDKDDSIHLDIPITGDINNPDFDPMHAIVKATSKAATVTLITFFTPYGLIYAGGNVVFDLATVLNFDPLDFKSGESKLNAVNKEQLDKLTGLLNEKPQVHLTLCGTTNQADLFALYPDLKKKQQTSKDKAAPEKEIVLTKEYTASLIKLATERQVNSKNYLINISKITHDRLILCEPAAQAEKDALSGVEINI
jgi:hypothetical protein